MFRPGLRAYSLVFWKCTLKYFFLIKKTLEIARYKETIRLKDGFYVMMIQPNLKNSLRYALFQSGIRESIVFFPFKRVKLIHFFFLLVIMDKNVVFHPFFALFLARQVVRNVKRNDNSKLMFKQKTLTKV